MADQWPLSRVYSNTVSSNSCMRGNPVHTLGESESSQTPGRRRLCGSTASGFTTQCRPDPLRVRRALSFELKDDCCIDFAPSREPCAEAELLPMSRFGTAIHDSVVFMPPATQNEAVMSAPPAVTAHMIMSNGPDNATKAKAQAQAIDERTGSFLGKLAVVGNLASLQNVTVGSMEDAGLLDLTLERAAQSLNVRLATLKVHLRVLGVSKWPSRKRSSIRKLLRHCPDLQGTSKQMVQYLDRSVGEVRAALQKEYNNVQCATPATKALIRHLRQRWYKSREYRHRQQTPPCGTNTPAQTTPTRATGASTEREPHLSSAIGQGP